MKSYLYLLSVLSLCLFVSQSAAQETGKVHEFFKKYFGEYYPKTTRHYTLYGNGLNGPADYNASLPVGDDVQGQIKSIIVRRVSPSRSQPSSGLPHGSKPETPPVARVYENSWQPTSFDPVAFARGGHRGRSDLTSDFDEAESRIITAEDAEELYGDATREFRIESSMSFSSPNSHNSKDSP